MHPKMTNEYQTSWKPMALGTKSGRRVMDTTDPRLDKMPPARIHPGDANCDHPQNGSRT